MMAIGNNLSSVHIRKQPKLQTGCYVLLKGGYWWVRHTKSQYWAVICAYLAGKKNSKCSGLHYIFPHSVPCYFFSQSNKVHPESFGPIMNIVWGKSPWCPCPHPGAQNNTLGSALVQLWTGLCIWKQGFLQMMCRWATVWKPKLMQSSLDHAGFANIGVNLSLEVDEM